MVPIVGAIHLHKRSSTHKKRKLRKPQHQAYLISPIAHQKTPEFRHDSAPISMRVGGGRSVQRQRGNRRSGVKEILRHTASVQDRGAASCQMLHCQRNNATVEGILRSPRRWMSEEWARLFINSSIHPCFHPSIHPTLCLWGTLCQVSSFRGCAE